MKKRITIIDDDPAILESLQYLLEDEGYEVTASEKQDSFVEKSMAENKPDLILLDYWLPKKTGAEITRELKSKEYTKNIPVIILSASHDVGRKINEFGADAFLAKPFDLDELLGLVNKYIS